MSMLRTVSTSVSGQLPYASIVLTIRLEINVTCANLATFKTWLYYSMIQISAEVGNALICTQLVLMTNEPITCHSSSPSACECNELGAVSDQCDSQGQCSCKSNVDPNSVKCNQCLDGYWNLTQSSSDGCQGMLASK